MNSANSARVYVWDFVVRAFHWTLAIAVFYNLFIDDEGEKAHKVLGYVATGFVFFRILWGFIGTKYARFSDFFPTPTSVREFIKSQKAKQHKLYYGHNPAASVVMILMFALMILIGITGFMMGTDQFFGEEWLEEIHGAIAKVLMGCVLIHLVGIALESRRLREPIWLSMITGYRKKRD